MVAVAEPEIILSLGTILIANVHIFIDIRFLDWGGVVHIRLFLINNIYIIYILK
jgi:hypothetical protein